VVKARHLVLSMGAGLSVPNPPKVPNQSSFEGTILDIGKFKNSSPWKGKRGVVVGSATAAHDGSPPVSFPFQTVSEVGGCGST
jgi:cation diffusion facilitator CzcD-associated flavoprotein CzcO